MPKSTGAHVLNALTAVRVRNEKKAGRYADGNGLYLVVAPTGAKRWIVRKVIEGRRRDIGLGPVRLVSLAEARQKALDISRAVMEGENPLAQPILQKPCPTFAEAAEQVHASHKRTWKSGKHQDQWLSTLKAHVFPKIGIRPIRDVERADVLGVIEPIWLTKPETARRVLQRIRLVMDWAEVAGHREGICPTHNLKQALPNQPKQTNHFAALPYAEVPAFLQSLYRSKETPVRLGFEFLVLTACRSGEVRGACWEEFDLEANLWTIPGARMKAGKEHVVPLVGRSLEIVHQVINCGGKSKFVFPASRGQMLSDMVFTKRLRDMGLSAAATAHGFRSSFRDWAAECTKFAPEVCEMALAHTIPSAVERAYRRGNLLAKRCELMQAWNDHCTQAPK
jgi:integrase